MIVLCVFKRNSFIRVICSLIGMHCSCCIQYVFDSQKNNNNEFAFLYLQVGRTKKRNLKVNAWPIVIPRRMSPVLGGGDQRHVCVVRDSCFWIPFKLCLCWTVRHELPHHLCAWLRYCSWAEAKTAGCVFGPCSYCHALSPSSFTALWGLCLHFHKVCACVFSKSPAVQKCVSSGSLL